MKIEVHLTTYDPNGWVVFKRVIDLPAVPRIGDIVEFEDDFEGKVDVVRWTPLYDKADAFIGIKSEWCGHNAAGEFKDDAVDSGWEHIDQMRVEKGHECYGHWVKPCT